MFLQQITSRIGHAALRYLIFLLQGILSNKYNDYNIIHCKTWKMANFVTKSAKSYANSKFVTKLTNFKQNFRQINKFVVEIAKVKQIRQSCRLNLRTFSVIF